MPTPIQRRAINTDLNPNWDAAEHSLRCAMEVIDWCQAEHINLAGLEARDIDTAMGEMPPGHQSPTDFLDMACALAAVRRLHFVVVQPQSVDAEMLAAVTNLLAAFEEERQILVDCSSVNGVVEDADDNEALAKFDAVIQPARAVIAKAHSAPKPQPIDADLLAACRAQHQAIDTLFAMLIELTKDQKPHCFYPSKSGQPWEAMVQGNAAIAKATESQS